MWGRGLAFAPAVINLTNRVGIVRFDDRRRQNLRTQNGLNMRQASVDIFIFNHNKKFKLKDLQGYITT